MLSCALPEPPQNRLCVCRANAKRRCIFDQFVILLGNDAPVNRVFGEHRLEAWIAIKVPGKRAIQLLARDGLEPRINTRRLAVHMPVDHNAWPPVADMPLSQQVLVPSTELFRV